MRAITLAGLMLLSLNLAAAPSRVVSLNLCTDQYLLLLADRSQIAALSQLADDPEQSYYARRAAGLPQHNGQADAIAALQPDLILSGQYSNRTASQLLKRLDYPVREIAHPQNLEQVIDQIRQLGQLLGQTARATRIIQQMEQQLTGLANEVRPPDVSSPSLLQYSAGGFTTGPATLTGELIRRAGWRNSASDAGIQYYGRLNLEQVLQLAPDHLLDTANPQQQWSAAQHLLDHPVLQRSPKPDGRLELPARLWNCGGPMLIDAINTLKQAREKLEQNRP